MTTRAVEFLHVWVSENMTPFSQDEDNPEAKELEEAAGGDLVAFVAGAIRRP